jgi:hypothetical protein
MDTLPKIKTQSNAKNKIMRAARMLPFLFPRLSARMSSRYSTGGFLFIAFRVFSSFALPALRIS